MLCERKIQRAKTSLMRSPKFALWSGILMMGKTEVVDTIPTACTNGRDEMYGRSFVDSLSDKELCFVILHENLHKALRHLYMWRKLYDENPKLANMACDYVINLMIVKSDPTETVAAMPRKDGKPIGLLDRAYEGMNAKQVYDLLKQKEESGSGSGGKGKGESGDGNGESGGFDEHDWDGAPELNEEEAEQFEHEIDRALRQGKIAHSRLVGTGGGGIPRDLEDLLACKIDWRDALREFVKTTCSGRDTSSWRRLNRRHLSADVYMPTLISEKLDRVVIGEDVSGSINIKQRTIALSEIVAVADQVSPEHMDLIYWDAEVAGHETYSGSDAHNIVSSTKPVGGGGTDPTCVLKYLNEKKLTPQCIVMITDGYVNSWGDDWPAPVLWIVIGNKDATASCGKTIHIDE